MARSGIGYVLSEKEEQESIYLDELTEYELGLVTIDILKKYCNNCAEEIKSPNITGLSHYRQNLSNMV